MIVLLLQLMNVLLKTVYLKEYHSEKLFTRIYLAENSTYTTQYFWKCFWLLIFNETIKM